MDEKPQTKKSAPKTTISNVEWGIVIGFLFLADVIQAGLDLIAIGVIINRILDVVIGFALAFYLQIRGQSMLDTKRVVGLLGSFVGEMIPGVDALPLWTADGFYNYSLYKASGGA